MIFLKWIQLFFSGRTNNFKIFYLQLFLFSGVIGRNLVALFFPHVIFSLCLSFSNMYFLLPIHRIFDSFIPPGTQRLFIVSSIPPSESKNLPLRVNFPGISANRVRFEKPQVVLRCWE